MLLEYFVKSTTKFQDGVQLCLKERNLKELKKIYNATTNQPQIKKATNPGIYCNWPTKTVQLSFHLLNTFVDHGSNTWYFWFDYFFQMLQKKQGLLSLVKYITISPSSEIDHRMDINEVYLRQKFCQILWTHFMSQMAIVGTCSKVFTLPSPCVHHISIFVDVSLGSVNDPNPRML